MIIAIIQARMGSTRLPGKVLKGIDGMSLLELQIERIKHSKLMDKFVVATSNLPQDDAIAALCKAKGFECFRGSEDDVLLRYYECAKKYKAKIVVRLTADCPLSDPEVIDSVIELYQQSDVDYAANTIPLETSTFPDGTDVEVFSAAALERANREVKDSHDREHVTFHFWKHGHDFKIIQLKQAQNWSKYRITVDYPEDIEVVSYIVRELKKRNSFGHLAEIISLIDANKVIREKNSQYTAGLGWQK